MVGRWPSAHHMHHQLCCFQHEEVKTYRFFCAAPSDRVNEAGREGWYNRWAKWCTETVLGRRALGNLGSCEWWVVSVRLIEY
eukprot:22304-Eustigmatos_ZCMA.PRE.1